MSKSARLTEATSWAKFGLILWVLCIQYFVVQVIVGYAYEGSFSLLHNTISDLGNTVCGMYGDRYVCSPLYVLMNVSFFLVGLTQAVGAILLYRGMKRTRLRALGFGTMVLAGLGTIVVALFPENTIGLAHASGAAMPFLIGNIGLIVLAKSLPLTRSLRLYTYASGVIALLALVLFMTETYLGLGLGGMERLVAYPQTIWMIVIGAYYLYRAQ